MFRSVFQRFFFRTSLGRVPGWPGVQVFKFLARSSRFSPAYVTWRALTRLDYTDTSFACLGKYVSELHNQLIPLQNANKLFLFVDSGEKRVSAVEVGSVKCR